MGILHPIYLFPFLKANARSIKAREIANTPPPCISCKDNPNPRIKITTPKRKRGKTTPRQIIFKFSFLIKSPPKRT